MKKFQELEYKRPDFEQVNKSIQELADKVKKASSESEVLSIYSEYVALRNEVEDNCMIAYLKALSDSSDKDLYEEMAFTQANVAKVHQDVFLDALLDSKYRPTLEQKYGKFFLESIEAEALLQKNGEELLSREGQLASEIQNLMASVRFPYEGKDISSAQLKPFFTDPNPEVRAKAKRAKLEGYLKNAEKYSSMIDELIHVRDGIAKANGFPNYLEYINISKQRFSYGEKELQDFCDLIYEKFSPLILKVNERMKARLGLEHFRTSDIGIIFPDGNAKPLGDVNTLKVSAQKMYDDMDSELAQIFRDMNENGYFDIEISDHKVTNMGLTTSIINEKMPYIFSNYTVDSNAFNVVFHEFGHAAQHYISMHTFDNPVLYDLPQDDCEIPSKTMELLVLNYLHLFFGDDYDKYKEEQLIKMLREVCDYCMIHEYETYLYTQIDDTMQQRIEKYYALTEKYSLGVEISDRDLIDQGATIFQNMIAFCYPRYLVCYSLCDISAVAIAEIYKKDQKKGMELFKKIGRIGGSMDYHNAMKAIDLPSAFTEEAVDYAVSYFKNELQL